LAILRSRMRLKICATALFLFGNALEEVKICVGIVWI
jgi:hypothetical protein